MEQLLLEVKKILNTPDEAIDLQQAAILLLKLNRNKILYQNIVRRNNITKLRYELQKIHNFRSNSKAQDEIQILERQAPKIIEITLTNAQKLYEGESGNKGKRSDHDQLPHDIQALVDNNLKIYREMRKIHEHLKLLIDSQPCDRYPLLKQLKNDDTQLRKNWETYDRYVPGSPSEANKEAVGIDKLISAARKYLSINKQRLKTLTGDDKQSLLIKMQDRLDLLIRYNAGISSEQIEELKTLGLTVPKNDS
ncbi:MAG: hypothetical protein LBF79_00660 [Dysgonamonadaceae bacterium]|jgi:hypothetical protein|nr:hypothetical protein [Dysgonamonadaceae bacterium]